MVDPLSVAAIILAIVDATKRVSVYAVDFKDAVEEKIQLKGNLDYLRSLLLTLDERCRHADPGDPWLPLLWQEYKEKDKYGALKKKEKGVLVQLKQVIEEMGESLEPTKAWKKQDMYLKLVWHFKKEKIKEIDAQITSCCASINLIFTLKNDDTANTTLELTQKLSEQTGTQLVSVDSRLSLIEQAQREEHEERRRRDLEADTEKAQAEKLHIISWLSPLSFVAKQRELYAECFDQAGSWLWADPRFREWADGRPWFLQCKGDMGVGKTVLSSILSHRLPAADAGSRLILSVYLDHKASRAQTQENLIGSLLKQVMQLDGQYVVPAELRKVYQQARVLEQTSKAYKNEIRQILIKEFQRYKRIYIILDGFDEIVSEERVKLRDTLLSLCPERMSLIITMRAVEGQTMIPGEYECNICEKPVTLFVRCDTCDGGEFDICYDCRAKELSCLDPDHSHPLYEPYDRIVIDFEDFEKDITNDIERYVRYQIGMEMQNNRPIRRDARSAGPDNPNWTSFQILCHADPDLPEQIVSAVTAKSKGRFLHARMYMESLRRGKDNVRLLRKALRNFPDSMEDIYGEAMHRVESNKAYKERAFNIIGLVGRARRTLKMTEVQYALAIMSLGDEEGELDHDDILDSTDRFGVLLDATSGLVIMENDGLDVRLVHQSLEEYVRDHRDKWIPTADIDIAKACLNFLKIVLPRKPCSDDDLRKLSSKFPFLEYAAQFWGDHVRDALSGSSPADEVMTAALELITDDQRLDMCIQAAWVTNPGGHDIWDVRRRVNKLHVCAWYGLSSIFSRLEPDRKLVDIVEPKYGQTPLMYACRKGHIEVIRQLVALGASLEMTSSKGRTGMFEAIDANHDAVVKLLVDLQPSDLSINAIHAKEDNRTALMLATRNGRLDMVSALLTYPDIDVNYQDSHGMTAIYLAAKYAQYSIMELLIQSGAILDTCDFVAGRSPLRCAAERGYTTIVDLLLRKGARLGLTDKSGATAMLYAVNNGQVDALENMMSHDVDAQAIRYEDHDKQTALHGASKNGAYRIVRLLLEAGLDPNPRDWIQRTPLHLAAQNGHLPVVAVLLEKGADSSLRDTFGETAKSIAWQYGHKSIIAMLRRTEEHDPSRSSGSLPTSDAEMPMWALARRGFKDLLVQAIKSRPQELKGTEPGSENSPLHCAVDATHMTIVPLLLTSSPHDLNKANHVGRTPLMTAALNGNLAAVQVLLAHQPGPDLILTDRWGSDTLTLAYANWFLKPDEQYNEIMFLLIEAGASLDPQQMKVDRIFFAAVDNGRHKTVKIILGQGFDRSTQNDFGLRALQIATAKHDIEMMQILNDAPTINFGEPTLDDTTPVVRKDSEDLRKTKFVPFRARPVVL